jgi:formate--tetrahydrofolate ligase
MDVNDRSLRDITINIKKDIKYQSGFDITAASEIMAIFCLANNAEELKTRIQNIIVAYTKDDKPIYVKDFNIIGAIMNLLTHAL